MENSAGSVLVVVFYIKFGIKKYFCGRFLMVRQYQISLKMMKKYNKKQRAE